MKPLLLILAAFFVQSCYTTMYVTGDYTEINETVVPPPPFYPPEPPPPMPVYTPAPDPVAPLPSQPVRTRTDGATRNTVTTTPSPQGTVRERVAAPSGNSTGSTVNKASGSQNSTPAQPAERQRVDGGTPQVKPARPRWRRS